MKLKITDTAAMSLALVSTATRVFFGVSIDMPQLYNAGWISTLLGGLIALPLIIAVVRLRASCDDSPIHALSGIRSQMFRPLAAILGICAAYDGAIIAQGICNSASYIAPNNLPLLYLMVPLVLMFFWCLSLNGNAIGASARLWRKIFPLILLIVFVVQFNEYRWGWLTPVLGPGIPTILNGALNVAGWISGLTALFLLAERDPRETAPRPRPFRTMLLGVGIVTLLILLRNLMVPTTLGEDVTRTHQLDSLISNGRASLSLQLPMTVLWFMCLFHLLLLDGFLCAAMLQTIIPKLHGRICVFLSVLLIAVLTMTQASTQRSGLMVAQWLFIIQAGVLALTMLLRYFDRGGVTHA